MARARRRTSSQPGLTVIYWIDIPAQVSARVGGKTEKVLLSDRFQHAIDRAAAVAEKTETQAYVAEWRRVDRQLADTPTGDSASQTPPDPATQAATVAAEIEAAYPRDRLEALVKAGGVDQSNPQPDAKEQPS